MEFFDSPKTIRRRILALWLPRLPTDRLHKLEPTLDGTPLVLSIQSSNARIVYAVDRNAARLNLRAGMPLASARAIVTDLKVLEADPPADRRKLTEIADWSDRFSPFVSLDLPHGLVMDITGVGHLFGCNAVNGEEALLTLLCNSLASYGYAACAAIAGTAVAAQAA
jgi:protein ImuB